MGSASDAINVAKGELHTVLQNGTVKYNDAFYGHASSAAWCNTFAWWVLNTSGSGDQFPYSAGCQPTLEWFNAKGQYTTDISSAQPGDLIFFDWGKDGPDADHIGIIESVNSDGTLTVIEGNSTNTNGGNNGVFENTYRMSYDHILGIARPKYDGNSVSFVPSNEFATQLSGSGSSNTSKSTTSPSYSFIYEEYESVATLSTQPFHAFVDLWIGDQHIPQIPPQYLVNCDITHLNSAGGAVDVSITLFDRYCDELEYLFHVNKDNIKLRFGHVSGRQSKILHLIAEQYGISFNPKGNLLTVKLTASGQNNSDLITVSGGENPSDAVRKICVEQGWGEGIIEDSVQLEGYGGEIVSFDLINENAEDYIRNVIAPRAVASDGLGGFQFYLDSTTSPNKANFYPIRLKSGGLRTYVYQKGKNSPVIDFSITSSLEISKGSVSEYVASGIDPLTKEEFNLTKKYSETVMYTSGTDKTAMKDSDSPAVLVTDNISRDEIAATTSYRFINEVTRGLEGTLTIVGDPTINITDNIRIIILNNDNTMHNVSGIYFVEGVNHNISKGVMITTLNVHKNGHIPEDEVVLKSARVVK